MVVKNDNDKKQLLTKYVSSDKKGDQNFIDKNNQQEAVEEVVNKLETILQNANKSLQGVRPEGNQQRNLDRETGGLEANRAVKKHVEDAWDKRSQEISKMIEDAQDLNNAAESTREQSFIHRKKQDKNKHKKQEKKIEEQKEAAESHVEKLEKNSARNSNNKGGRGL